MMTITYLFQTAICWFIFLVFYHYVLRRSSHYQLSRIYLLGALALGAIIPLLPGFSGSAPEIVYTIQNQLGDMVVEINAFTEPNATSTFNFSQLLNSMYIMVMGVLLIRILFGVLKIYQIRAIQTSRIGSILIKFHKEKLQPFSFLNHVFIPLNYPAKYKDIVSTHEVAHARQGHSIDVLLTRILAGLFWVNPMVRYFEIYLKETHELFADQQALTIYSVQDYKNAIKYSAFAGTDLALTHSFNSTNLTQRLKNMKNQNSPIASKLLYLAILPIAVILSMALNVTDDFPVASSMDQIKESTLQLLHADAMSSESTLLDTIPPKKDNSSHAPTVLGTQLNLVADYLYKEADVMPRFPGCEDMKGDADLIKDCAAKKMFEFLGSHIKYPALAKKHGVDGMVLLQFTVTETGEIINAIISRNVGHGCGEEALRVVNLMTKEAGNWIPGMKDGKAVNVQFQLPIKFKIDSDESNDLSQEDEPYKLVDQQPRFPGCESMEGDEIAKKECAMKKMLEYLYKHIIYPAEARTNGTQGTAVISFIVERDGVLSNFESKRKVGDGCENEALRVIQSMNKMNEKWTPGMLNGKKVRVEYILPIKFKLEDNSTTTRSKELLEIPAEKESDDIFKIVEERPRFPGCEDLIGTMSEKENCATQAMLEFLYTNVTYPAAAKSNETEGTTVIQFIVEKDGSLGNPKIVRDVANGCGEEALRVVNLMNDQNIKWIPGKQRGKLVRVQYNLPIKFKLAEEKEEQKSDKH